MKDRPGEYEHTSMSGVTATMEDYLKVIFDLNKTKKIVRVKDIAKELDVKMPTVTSMLKKVANRGLVKYRKYEYVELEAIGVYFAREISRRHEILLRFLADILTVEKKIAVKEACKMEHLLSSETLSTLTDFMDFVESCPQAREKWPVRFKSYRENGCRLGLCEQPDANTAGVEKAGRSLVLKSVTPSHNVDARLDNLPVLGKPALKRQHCIITWLKKI